jgi:hypothetical protein
MAFTLLVALFLGTAFDQTVFVGQQPTKSEMEKLCNNEKLKPNLELQQSTHITGRVTDIVGNPLKKSRVELRTFNRKLAIWKLPQEWNESIRELVTVSKHVSLEKRELENNWSQLRTEDVHRFQEFRKFCVAVHQNFVMGNGLRDLHGEDEAFRCSSIPVLNRACSRTCVESRIHLDGMKSFGVESQTVRGLHTSRIERSLPAAGRER